MMDIKVEKGQSVSSLLTIIIIGLTAIIVIIIAIAIFIALSLGKGIANSIDVPLNKIKERLSTFAKGDPHIAISNS